MTSWWARYHLKSPAPRLFTQPFIQGADQRKHQSSASLVFVRWIHRWPVNSPHKGPVTRKMFPFDDVTKLHANFAMIYWVNKGHTRLRYVIINCEIYADKKNTVKFFYLYFNPEWCMYASVNQAVSEFTAQMASNAENVSIWWRHQATC